MPHSIFLKLMEENDIILTEETEYLGIDAVKNMIDNYYQYLEENEEAMNEIDDLVFSGSKDIKLCNLYVESKEKSFDIIESMSQLISYYDNIVLIFFNFILNVLLFKGTEI